MQQRVIIEQFIVTGENASTDIKPTSALQMALNDGWRVVGSSSTTLPSASEIQMLYVTFILEKAEEEVIGKRPTVRDYKK